MNTLKNILLAIAVIGILAGIFFLGRWSKKLPEYTEHTDTVTVYDTHRYSLPTYYTEKPLFSYKRNDIPQYIFFEIRDTVVKDSIIYRPIAPTQRYYRDTEYEAWVSGFYPQLDSINIFSKTNNIYHTITAKEKVSPSHNVYAGASLMFDNKARFSIDAGYYYRWKCLQVGAGFRYEPIDRKAYGVVNAGVVFGW